MIEVARHHTVFGPSYLRSNKPCVALFASLLILAGCSSLRPKPTDQFVYVTAKQTYLRDRVAAVSNRTGTVDNGERLKILERGRRFIRVQSDKGESGWIDEKTIATQQTFDAFAALGRDHAKDPTIASAVVRDEVYLHLTPGRSTDRFYRLAEGDKLSLLQRATLLKGAGPNQKSGPAKNPKQAAIPGAASGIKSVAPGTTPPPPPPAAATSTAAATPEPPAPPPMEDWWLVRDAQGHTGWMLSRLMDVDAPDALTRYAEGQRIVGAYLLSKVYDSDAPQDDKNIPEYVTVLSPYKAGLTYDFDQVRVFIWNEKKHRYETAFREKNVAGYLPVQVKMMQDLGGKAANSGTPLPGFTYKVLPADAAPVVPDPITGAIVPGPEITKTYRLEGNILHRLLPPGTPPPDELHPDPEPDKKDRGRRSHKSARGDHPDRS